ncbi:MAG: DUF393 domain-containing protein, partial [Verrucomicrobia bacterium]|nr:DUF393 domain-containing protein [Verrucomicrobiota bacterium]
MEGIRDTLRKKQVVASRLANGLDGGNIKPMARVTLFYDADCGFCQASVDWLVKKGRPGTFETVAYQDEERLNRYPMVDRTMADKGIQ